MPIISRNHSLLYTSSLKYDTLIRAAAVKNDLEPALLRATFAVESSYDERWTREKNWDSVGYAYGFGQLHNAVFIDMGYSHLTETERLLPANNITVAGKLLGSLVRRAASDRLIVGFDPVVVGVSAYNAGFGGTRSSIRSRGTIPNIPYVEKVLSARDAFRILEGTPIVVPPQPTPSPSSLVAPQPIQPPQPSIWTGIVPPSQTTPTAPVPEPTPSGTPFEELFPRTWWQALLRLFFK